MAFDADKMRIGVKLPLGHISASAVHFAQSGFAESFFGAAETIAFTVHPGRDVFGILSQF